MEGGIDGESSDIEVVIGAGEVVGGGVKGGVEVGVEEAGGRGVGVADEDGESNGGVWMVEAVGASVVVVVGVAVGGPFLLPC